MTDTDLIAEIERLNKENERLRSTLQDLADNSSIAFYGRNVEKAAQEVARRANWIAARAEQALQPPPSSEQRGG